jgi:nucleotide-binding universal stress UspA family protein
MSALADIGLYGGRMNSLNNVLLASHGTDGAIAAEKMALSLCSKGTKLHHLIVVPTLWEGMTGDDWLNNGSTRDTFRRYLETELGREVDEHCERVSLAADERELEYSKTIVVGEPDECLLTASNNNAYDLVIIGSPRPKGVKGIRSRMTVESLARSLAIPLLIVPYPNE